jgi:Uma2 family endonuclease
MSELVGFDKMNPAATPKSFSEVLSEWPRLLGVSVIVFVAVWWWQTSQKEPETVICSNCKEVIEKEKVPEPICRKCGGRLEEIEGFYDRHPDLR